MSEHTQTVTFWFDPGCPFTWRTSRWLSETAPRHGATVEWAVMSLGILNEGREIPEQYRDLMARMTGVRRVLAATARSTGPAALDRLYTALGTRMHDKGESAGPDLLRAALSDAGLPESLAAAADDASLDDDIRSSHEAGQARVGTESGSPILAIGDGPGSSDRWSRRFRRALMPIACTRRCGCSPRCRSSASSSVPATPVEVPAAGAGAGAAADPGPYCQVVTTVDSAGTAQALARSAVQERLAACAQVGPPITSVYRWEGAIEQAQEWTVVFKTTMDLYAALERHILGRHPYEVPEILALPVAAGNAAYLSWLRAQTREASEE